jgi:O-antigen ligase
MELSSYFKLKSPKIQQSLGFLLIFSLFFPIRYVILAPIAFKTGAYSDFTSFSLYLSDIIILALFCLNIGSIYQRLRRHHVILGLICWIFLAFLLQHVWPLSLNYYFFARFLELIVVYLIFSGIVPPLPTKTLIYSFVGLGTFQSLIALYQFLAQKSLGLYKLGESHVGPSLDGVAKLVSHGTKFIRAYGTFPHSNLLAAFLFTTILFSFYLLFIAEKKWQKSLFSAALIINIFGLTVSFSRAGLGATILITAIYLGWLILSQRSRKKALSISALTLIAFLAAFIPFHQFLSARATLTDKAVKERIFYNQVGKNIIKTFPWQGIGFGSSVLRMQQFSPLQLEPWEVQPIHNYYLLAAAEIGVIGALLFILLFFWHLIELLGQLIKNHRHMAADDYLYKFTLLAVLAGFLVLMLFDHYFYTIEQTQLLLWLILGLCAADIARAKNYL